MDRETAIAELKSWQGGTDEEIAHAQADEVLCKLLRATGYGDVVEEWLRVEKWYA